jgi:hypothetical protein
MHARCPGRVLAVKPIGGSPSETPIHSGHSSPSRRAAKPTVTERGRLPRFTFPKLSFRMVERERSSTVVGSWMGRVPMVLGRHVAPPAPPSCGRAALLRAATAARAAPRGKGGQGGEPAGRREEGAGDDRGEGIRREREREGHRSEREGPWKRGTGIENESESERGREKYRDHNSRFIATLGVRCPN